jgi:hypothetical protein
MYLPHNFLGCRMTYKREQTRTYPNTGAVGTWADTDLPKHWSRWHVGRHGLTQTLEPLARGQTRTYPNTGAVGTGPTGADADNKPAAAAAAANSEV